VSHASPLKQTSVGTAWAAWADGSLSAGSEFLQRISSWIEGTSAQLLRAKWRPGTERPTSAELEGRLRHHLEVVAQTGLATYPQALDQARQGLIDEITAAAVAPKGPARRSTTARRRRPISGADHADTGTPKPRSPAAPQSGR
jgi:hypothetical protein